ncbi:hypothetical protein Nepgr_012023 [Nepenthes gracilis]|uniref:Uncharacterized protein n=1 Tax=Nepenthes gracilis TaxID=150966 RepID=A0AAD3XMH5_NEPGR|nr:hypothetical protein Nepgr_012023 [Nepenthes gracilis]
MACSHTLCLILILLAVADTTLSSTSRPVGSAAPWVSPNQAPQMEENVKCSTSEGTKTASSGCHERIDGERPAVQVMKKERRQFDKSVTGGVVILGGLASTFLVAVFCYIRATGRKHAQNGDGLV